MNAFQHVLVGLDLHSANARPLLSRACQIAALDDIEVIHVCDHLHDHHEDFGSGAFASSEELDNRIIAEADARLEDLCRGFGITHHQVLGGKTVDKMHEYASEHADLVVVGSHGRNGVQTIFGSTSNAMLHSTPCDVLAVHVEDNADYEPSNYKCIIVGVDLTEESNRVMEHALRIAEAVDATVALCHVYTTHDKQSQAKERRQLEELGTNYNIEPTRLYSLSGNTVPAIRELGKELGADLIVVGTHGTHGMELLKGSMPNAVLHGAQCDMLGVRIHA